MEISKISENRNEGKEVWKYGWKCANEEVKDCRIHKEKGEEKKDHMKHPTRR